MLEILYLMKKRILFIDDEVAVLESLKRALFSMNQEWEMAFANSGAKALELMAEKSFNIVVSDMVMPGMSGAELLDEVSRLYPQTARFILSGHALGAEVLRCIASSDYFFVKPANLNDIKAAIRSVLELQT
jgi:DNA-binding NtrC family response regulator